MHLPAPQHSAAPLERADIAERLQWLLRLRWLIIPLFVAVDLATDLLLGREAPWTALAFGGALVALNGLYTVLLARGYRVEALLRWARVESAVVVALPVLMVVLDHDPTNPLRYGVLVGVVGAAVVLPRTGEVAVVGIWACSSLIVADALAFDLDASRITNAVVARWAMESGVIVTVAIIAGYLHQLREHAETRLHTLRHWSERARVEWEATFDNVAEMVVITDLDGVVLRVNRVFAKATGARAHDLSGRRLDEILAGHPDRWWSFRTDGLVEFEDPVFDTLFEVRATRLDDRVVLVARDVGEQRRLYTRLVQADKLAAVGVLASGIAHDINNPTAFVTSNLTELKRYVQAYESVFSEVTEIALACGEAERLSALLQRGHVAFARHEAQDAIAESLQGMERIRQYVTNLRTIARRDQPGEPMQAVALSDVVDAVTRTASHDLRAVQARIDVAGPLWVMGHRSELVDVILNLVVNAIQASDEGRPNRIAIDARREGGSAVIRVSDTGKGIPPAHVKRIFEPFFTTKAAGQGTGLGLSLARNIVLAHGGSIDVATELGEGSTFTVRLPLFDPETPSARTKTPCPRAELSLRTAGM
jgi:two-component system NtrC family sensor kinase